MESSEAVSERAIVFGRRNVRLVCDSPCLDEATCSPQNLADQQANGCVHWAFKDCRLDATYYDYDGLSSQVITERKSPAWERNPLYPNSSNDPWSPTGEDRFVATYLYGPMGPISRTAEMGDSDVNNNQESYYLRDAMGGSQFYVVFWGCRTTTTTRPPFFPPPLSRGDTGGFRSACTTPSGIKSRRVLRRPPARSPGGAAKAA